ncbi:unnamed protein product [Brassicogethes aeneus]|uniref:Uncharacterized protein n=1 Tax=Brassicogethes aeneus TaxID=1431903 RepID=A0A9P0B944_BRAAE|nr:unnamed protein product [Brassicogethes aeneus]
MIVRVFVYTICISLVYANGCEEHADYIYKPEPKPKPVYEPTDMWIVAQPNYGLNKYTTPPKRLEPVLRGYELKCKSYDDLFNYNSPDFHKINQVTDEKIIFAVTNIFPSTISPQFFHSSISIFNYNELYLSNLNITNILPGAFNMLHELKVLRLDNNNLSNVNDGVYNSLSALSELNLESNNIKTITEHAFLGMTHLKILNLRNNTLGNVNETILTSLVNLEELDLSKNCVTSIETISVMFFKLKKLYLHENNIFNLQNISFKNMIHLSDLDLGFNNISLISPQTFSGLTKLLYLKLNNNKLSLIPNGCFRYLTSLEMLDLSNNNLNKISYGTFDNLNNLETLNLSSNNLISIQTITFFRMKYLDLSSNKITEFDRENIQKLQEVSLDKNPWNCETLIKIVQDLSLRYDPIIIKHGHEYNSNNILGIKCSKTENIKSDNSIEKNTNETFYKYFKDLEESHLLKNTTFVLQGVIKNMTEILKTNFVHLLKDFEESHSLKNTTFVLHDVIKNMTEILKTNFDNFFNSFNASENKIEKNSEYFLNLTINKLMEKVKFDLENIERNNDDIKLGSEVVKIRTILETMAKINLQNTSNISYEKLVSKNLNASEVTSILSILVVIAIVLFIVLGTFIYNNFLKININNRQPQEVLSLN